MNSKSTAQRSVSLTVMPGATPTCTKSRPMAVVPSLSKAASASASPKCPPTRGQVLPAGSSAPPREGSRIARAKITSGALAVRIGGDPFPATSVAFGPLSASAIRRVPDLV